MESIVVTEKGEIMPPGTPSHITPEPSTHEPSMFYPRPSSERSQDVSHVLASTFRELYTRDVMGKSMVRNLTVSSDGSSDFHRRCMEHLKEAHEEHKKRLQECDMLEKHIIQARARATSADERALSQAANNTSTTKYLQLGLPHVSSNFRWCLDEETLKKHDLIVPSDFYPKSKPLVDGPKAAHTPHFSIPTISSSLHLVKGPVDDGYTSKEDLQELEELKFKDEDSMTTLSSDSEELISSPPRTVIKPGKSKKMHDKDRKDRWRENMPHDQRVSDRAGLARIEERHNFLKNPRFLPLTDPKASKLIVKDQPKKVVVKAGRKVSEYTTREESIQIFMPRPQIVLFTEWTVGKVYEAVLELKNVSSVSRQLRLIPPVTSFFSIGLGKYPGVHGLVAPGMSAKFNIRFMPDSLANYEDFVTVVSQAEEPLKVAIEARRNSPIITMPKNLQCGHSLVGGTKITELVLKNNGGSGRFCILKKSSWPAANFKTVVSPGTLDLGVFQIRPAVFELLAGQSMVIELIFSPSKSEKYAEDIVMVCDNCQLQHLTIEGEGQSAAVELVSVSDGGEDQAHLGEISDMTADHLIHFPPLNPHSFFMRQILVHNSTNVEMPYTWHTLKPNLQTSLRPDQQNLLDRFEFYPDESPAFFIEPQQGCLQPNGIHEFVVTFAPHLEGKYHNVLHLVLSNIPESTAKSKVQAHKGTMHDATSIEGVAPHSTGKKAMELSSTPTMLKKAAPARLNRPSPNGIMHGAKGGKHIREVIALEVELKGNSIPYSVLLHPPAIVIPGSVLEGTTVKRPLKIANYSLAPVQFKWSAETQPSIIEMEPPLGIIDPGDFIEVEVSVTGSKPGPLSCDLHCKVEHLEDPLTLNIRATITGPHVVISNPSIDYGLVRLGQTINEKVTFRNTTQLPALWKFFESEYFYRDKGTTSSKLTVTPEYGELGPLGEAEVTVTYKPDKTEKLFTVLDLEIKDGKSSHISVNAQVQSPQACFMECDVVFSEAFLSVPQVRTVILFNQTMFPTKFKFAELRGKQTKTSHVTVYPMDGMLAPREKLEIQITFVSHEEGEVTGLFLPCHIEEMKKPIVLSFYANIRPLAVEYATPDSESEGLLVKYENPVKIGEVATRKITFENKTAIRAPWSTYVETFSANPPTPPAFKLDFKSAKSRRAMLGRTPNLCDPLAKTSRQAHQDHCNMILSRKLGAAFTLKPSRGFLEPYQTQVIEVEAYSNMWGSYRDNVVCNIEGVPAKVIPVELDIVGCPLVFQVVAGQQDKTAVVRFGTHINNGPQVQRKMRINNTSPMDIRVDWKVYNLPEPTDNKLLDLNVWYGRAFPRLDGSGKEIPRFVEKEISDSHTVRSTPYIVDTPDSGSTEVSNVPEKTIAGENTGKVVNVLLKPHFGQNSNSPFSILPSQAIVPANGHVTVSALFSPVMEEEQSKEWKAFANGYMTLDDPKLKQLPDEKLRRLDGYEVTPLHLEMTAMVRMGCLHIEKDDDEGDGIFEEPGEIVFNTAFSDILQQNKVCEEAIQYRYCTLRNNTEMPLNFKMSVTRPFFIALSGQKSERESRQPIELRIESSARNTLIPQANKRVKLGFRVSSLIMNVLHSQRDMHHIPGTELKRDSATGAETVVFRDDLTITYSNGTTQLLPVVAHITMPALRLSCHSLDFGTCFVGQERCLQVKIENVGESHSQWHVILNACDTNSHCFRVEPNDGLLEGHTTHLAKNKMLLSVYFIARSDEECMATFIFRGLLGEIEQQLVLRGVGSYDGMYEV